ncbi:hypothetical protein ACX80D_17525 [Arthrobacter sp. Sr24]
MQARDPEHIITIASAASIVTMPGEASCAANKYDVLGYLGAVREEFHRSPVQISVITQSVVNTALAAGTATGTAKLLTPETTVESVLRTIERPRLEVCIPDYLGPVVRAVKTCPEHCAVR